MKIFYSILAIAVIFAGCTEKCEEPDISRINSVYIELKEGGEDGFTDAELDSIIIVRYIPFSAPLVADTLVTNGDFPEGDNKFLINDEYPFVNATPPYYVVYGYEIIETSSLFSTRIEGIELEGVYDGECDYMNVEKTFLVDSNEVDMSGSTDFYQITR